MKLLAIAAVNVTQLLAVSAFVVDGNLAAAAGALISTVVGTLLVARWVDSRIEHKLNNHAHIESMEHHAIIMQVSMLRELLGHPPLDATELLKPVAILKGT